MFMLGYAYQAGALPLSAEAIEKAIEMNGEAVAMNIAAFRYGRRAAVDPAAVEALVKPAPELANDSLKLSQSFDETVERRVAFLTAYQSARYARRYRSWVEKVQSGGSQQGARRMRAVGSGGALSVQADGLQGRVRGGAALHRHLIRRAREGPPSTATICASSSMLAPPLLARRDKATGEPKKMSFGPWMLGLLRVLKKFKFLRGTPLDPFGYTAERKTERRLIADYEKLLAEIVDHLTPENHGSAVALASLPEKIRGYGPVKERHIAVVKAEEAALIRAFPRRRRAVSQGGGII